MVEPIGGPLAHGKLYPGYGNFPGFERCELRSTSLVARDSLANAFVAVIEQHETLYAWAREQEQPTALRGRAPVYVANLPTTPSVDIAVRHAWHGGMLAPITSDRYLRPTRAPRELLNSWHLRALKIPTPEFLAFALYKAGPFSVRVDVATRYVPNSFDFSVVLKGVAPSIDRHEAIDAVEKLLVQLAAHGFTHPDLNVKNILLYRENQKLIAAMLDVDVVQSRPEVTPATTMLANVSRLARSMRKAQRQFGIAIKEGELSGFVERMLSATPVKASRQDSSASTSSNR
ncbi:MAG: lipopolysaccharide kinase InaA family protein [Gemmatimonadaceae bacterium]